MKKRPCKITTTERDGKEIEQRVECLHGTLRPRYQDMVRDAPRFRHIIRMVYKLLTMACSGSRINEKYTAERSMKTRVPILQSPCSD